MFTPEQQKEHRLQLADILEKHVKDNEYNHLTFTGTNFAESKTNSFKCYPCNTTHCAGGWAAVYQIGGLFDEEAPKHRKVTGCMSALDYVFGFGTYADIFAEYTQLRYKSKSRAQVIEELRTWEPWYNPA
jgi:hypothetical protein